MTVVCRPGTPADAPACAAVHLASAMLAYRDIFPAAAEPPTTADLTPGWLDVTWVAEVQGRVVGGVRVARDADMPSGWVLSRVHVHPEHWGSGAGGTLLERAAGTARHQRAGAINLWVLEPNTRARAICERRGWRLIPGPTLANEGTDAVDVLYQLDLEP